MSKPKAIPADFSARTVPQALPRILHVEDIAELFHLTIGTVRQYTGNKELNHLLPKWFKFPGQRRLCWLDSTVHEFLLAAQVEPDQDLPKPKGRPTKSEQIAQQRLHSANEKLESDRAHYEWLMDRLPEGDRQKALDLVLSEAALLAAHIEKLHLANGASIPDIKDSPISKF